MSPGTPEPEARRHPDWAWPAVLGLVAVAVYAISAQNGFVGDDVHVIATNPRVQQLQSLGDYLGQSYWPAGYGGGLYRPLTILWFALQWRLGGGSPLLFHLVSIILFGAITIGVWRIARLALPEAAAGGAALLFAVHPVHVEAVANVVGQSELLVALLHAVAVAWYVVARRRGPLAGGVLAGLALLYLLSCAAKESGLVLPGILLAAELTVLGTAGPWRERLRAGGAPAIILLILGLGFLAARADILGSLAGETPTIAIRGVPTGTRLLTMLGVVPEWWRLLLFPRHLQADYLPMELDRATGFGSAEFMGLVCLVAWVLLIWRSRRTAPMVAFGLTWAAVALFPVSNLVVPTGILLAERTLFSASIGVCLALGGAVAMVQPRLSAARPALRALAGALLGAVLLAGGGWSATRATVWHDDERMIRQTVLDAPLSYHAHALYGRLLFDQGRPREGEQEFLAALKLYPHDPEIFAGLGQRYRNAGMCQPAVPLFEEALRMAPEMTPVRNMLIYCLLQTGDSAGVERQLAEKVRRGDVDALLIRARVDSAYAARHDRSGRGR